jgi:hypothetical protein
VSLQQTKVVLGDLIHGSTSPFGIKAVQGNAGCQLLGATRLIRPPLVRERFGFYADAARVQSPKWCRTNQQA